MTWKYIRYESLASGTIARVTLDRVRTRNAQSRGLLVELGEAFARAEADDDVRVVILSGAGPLFSSGHDMGSREAVAERTPGPEFRSTTGCKLASRFTSSTTRTGPSCTATGRPPGPKTVLRRGTRPPR